MWSEPIPVTGLDPASSMYPPTWETGHQQTNEDAKAASHFMILKALTTLIYSLLDNTVVKLQLLALKKRNI